MKRGNGKRGNGSGLPDEEAEIILLHAIDRVEAAKKAMRNGGFDPQYIHVSETFYRMLERNRKKLLKNPKDGEPVHTICGLEVVRGTKLHAQADFVIAETREKTWQ